MKINWVAPHFYPETGGVETHVKQISNQLIERGHEVLVHTSAQTVNKKTLHPTGELGDIKIKRYEPSLNRGFYLCLWKPDIREGDLVAMEGYPSLTNDYVRRKYSTDFPLVIYAQGVVLPVTGFAALAKRIYDATSGVKTLKKANRIIAMTELEKNWCREKGIDIKKISIIPNGVFDEAFNKYDTQIAKEKYGLDDYMLFIGRMYHEKSPTHLVRALASLHDDFKELGVIFIGPDQGEAAKVKAVSKELGLEKRVVYAGQVSEKEKYELLAGCKFFALPSQHESQGIVFVEAWAQKKAVIGTKVGGVPYIIEDGETGLLYNHGDLESLTKHIKFFLENPDRAKAIGEKGFEIASREWRWKNVIDRIEKLYNECVAEFKKKA
ncbi:MAG: glycosyltransferase family 4 protein [Methanomassiliicoccales archaeon]|nr:MAG: glycosyltransferase family 4 protein [Methanomassiliicoccales archaeon]